MVSVVGTNRRVHLSSSNLMLLCVRTEIHPCSRFTIISGAYKHLFSIWKGLFLLLIQLYDTGRYWETNVKHWSRLDLNQEPLASTVLIFDRFW